MTFYTPKSIIDFITEKKVAVFDPVISNPSSGSGAFLSSASRKYTSNRKGETIMSTVSIILIVIGAVWIIGMLWLVYELVTAPLGIEIPGKGFYRIKEEKTHGRKSNT